MSFTAAGGIVRQGDGKLVAVFTVDGGGCAGFVTAIDVARLNADGSLDSTFGSGGYAQIPSPSASVHYEGDGSNGGAIALESSDQKLAVGAEQYDGTHTYPLLARLNTNGTLDSTFGSGGVFVDTGASSPDPVHALAFDQNGKLLAAGGGGDLRRYTLGASPSLDWASSPSIGQAEGIAVQPDGNIVLAAIGQASGHNVAVVARFIPGSSSAQLDPSFGAGGCPTVTQGCTNITLSGSHESLYTVTLENSQILVAGTASDGGSLIARLTSTGQLDTSFGTNGKVDIPATGVDAAIHTILYDPYPGIIGAGTNFASPNDHQQVAVTGPNGETGSNPALPDGTLQGATGNFPPSGNGTVDVTGLDANNNPIVTQLTATETAGGGGGTTTGGGGGTTTTGGGGGGGTTTGGGGGGGAACDWTVNDLSEPPFDFHGREVPSAFVAVKVRNQGAAPCPAAPLTINVTDELPGQRQRYGLVQPGSSQVAPNPGLLRIPALAPGAVVTFPFVVVAVGGEPTGFAEAAVRMQMPFDGDPQAPISGEFPTDEANRIVLYYPQGNWPHPPEFQFSGGGSSTASVTCNLGGGDVCHFGGEVDTATCTNAAGGFCGEQIVCTSGYDTCIPGSVALGTVSGLVPGQAAGKIAVHLTSQADTLLRRKHQLHERLYLTTTSNSGTVESMSYRVTLKQCPPPGRPALTYKRCADVYVSALRIDDTVTVEGVDLLIPATKIVDGQSYYAVATHGNNGPERAAVHEFAVSSAPFQRDPDHFDLTASWNRWYVGYEYWRPFWSQETKWGIDPHLNLSFGETKLELLELNVSAADAYDPVPENNSERITFRVVGRAREQPRINDAGASGVSGTVQTSPKQPHHRTVDITRTKRAPRLKSIEVAILNVSKSPVLCRWVTSTGSQFTPQRPGDNCDPPVWLLAHGGAQWSLQFSHRLPPGRYVFLARATDTAGDLSAMTVTNHTEVGITVH